MSSIPIFLSSDDNYAPFVATTIASICDNTKSFCEFYILDGGITEENKEKICELKKQFGNFSIEFIKIDFEKYFKDFKETERISKSMYSRFLIPYLKPEIEKAIYSDVDVIVLDDIKKMYDIDLEGYILGGVEEIHLMDKERNDRINRLNLSTDCNYFASGNLLIDCKKWKDENITKKLLETAVIYKDKLLLPDMDVLNIVFDKKAKMLPQEYCWMNRKYDYFKKTENKIIIRHFEGELKPWQIHPNLEEDEIIYRTKDKDLFWKYAKMTVFYEELFSKVIYNTKEDLKKYKVFELIRKRNKSR